MDSGISETSSYGRNDPKGDIMTRIKENALVKEIQEELFRRQDLKYRELQIRTIPSVPAESMIGVRTPELRAYAKDQA